MKAKTAIEIAMMKTAPIISIVEGIVVEWRPSIFNGYGSSPSVVVISTENEDVRMESEKIPVGARVKFTQTKYCNGSTKEEGLEIINLTPPQPEFPHFITTVNHKGKEYDLYYGNTKEITGKSESKYVEVVESIAKHGFILLPEDFKFVFHRKLPRFFIGHTTCYIDLVYQSGRMESRMVSHGDHTVHRLGTYSWDYLKRDDGPGWEEKNIWLLMKPHE